MATIVSSPRARRNLERIVQTHALHDSTKARVSRSNAALARLPLLGAPLSGRWAPFRFIVGPWRWMIIVYEYDEAAGQVAIVTIQDARSARAATGDRAD